MTRKHFDTRAQLERQMDAARQLRSETLAGAIRIVAAFAGAAVRRSWLRIVAHAPRQFPIVAERRAPGPGL